MPIGLMMSTCDGTAARALLALKFSLYKLGFFYRPSYLSRKGYDAPFPDASFKMGRQCKLRPHTIRRRHWKAAKGLQDF